MELESALVDVVLRDEAAEVVDDDFVVGGDAAEDGAADEVPHELAIVGVNVELGGESDCCGLFVSTFAKADADALGDETTGVLFCAEEVGLKDGADGSGILLMQSLGELQGGLGILGAFHIDADEVLGVEGVGDDFADDALGEGWPGGGSTDVHADLGELDAYVGTKSAGGDCVEQLVIDCGAGFSLCDLKDAFTEGIKGDIDAFGVKLGGGGDGFVDGHAGHEAA